MGVWFFRLGGEFVRLTATVRQVTGSTTERVAVSDQSGWQLEPAVAVEIVESDGGFLLIRFSAKGFAGDTWHATVKEAKRQAEVEYAISPVEWCEEPSG